MSLLSITSIHLKKPTMPSTTEPEEAIVHPDSTTPLDKERPAFNHGQDVLLKHKDGRYYLGTVVEVDIIREQCLVKFGDNTDSWSGFKDLTKLSMPEEDLLCVVCKKSGDKFEVKVCDKCGRGYHMSCHQPEIPPECQKEGATWMCKKCVDSQQGRNRSIGEKTILRKENIRKVCSGVDTMSIPPTDKSKLPYDPDLLNWDTYHRVNIEQIYCYCGRNGEWYTQMLQCGRCRQWFHEKCVRCLKYPLYCGDRFYVFVCSVCNNGKEFVRRLELKWVDMVHLMLFNLTAFNVKKYYDLDKVVIPYVNANWHYLQLPPKIYNVSEAERRENILSVLTNNRNRFKCGREIKKRTTIWGLRVRLPPPAPCVTLPTTGTITEEGLRERWEGNRRLQFISVPPEEDSKDILNIKTEVINNSEIKSEDEDEKSSNNSTMINIMRGTAYQNHTNLSETESPCPSPNSNSNSNSSQKTSESKFNKMDYHGGGFVKKSVPFPKINLQRRKRLMSSLNVRDREKLFRRQKRKLGSKKSDNPNFNSKKTRRLNLKSINDKVACKKPEVNLPLTPPTSVSAPPTPPASSTPLQTTSNHEISSDYTLNSIDLANNLQNLNKSNSRTCSSKPTDLNMELLNTPCSSGDETSSKSTLDLIIPPPKDFEGKNNPFHALLKSTIQTQNLKPRTSITLPLPLTAVIPSQPIVRPTKRQLSEKDICIGPNGEVKRKRLRRRTFSTAGQTASKTATVVPARPDNKEWNTTLNQRTLRSNQVSTQINNCVDYALNGRRLRARQEKFDSKNQDTTKNKIQPITANISPVKQEPEINMNDLKTSVNIYFGAENRIASGERFAIKAKRIGPTGKIQYLIEWEGPNQGMT